MGNSSSSPPHPVVTVGALHYDHERAGYCIPSLNTDTGKFEIEWPFREEWSVEERDEDEFEQHYTEFCEVVPSAVMDEPMQVILQFAFNEYESLRARLGGGHSYESADVDRISDLGVALRLLQKETEYSID